MMGQKNKSRLLRTFSTVDNIIDINIYIVDNYVNLMKAQTELSFVSKWSTESTMRCLCQ